MNLSSLIAAIAKETGLTKQQVQAVLKLAYNHVVRDLKTRRRTRIYGIGTFSMIDVAARKGRNPKTGEEIPITARRVVTFHASQKLKGEVELSYNGTQS